VEGRLCRVMFLALIALPAVRSASAADGWDIELHAGALISTNPAAGTSALPPTVPVVLIPPQRTLAPTPVSSWYFGDGAQLLSQLAPARPGIVIVPLDPVMQSRFVQRQSGGSVGVRVGRRLSSRFSVELAIDRGSGDLTLLPASQDTIKASQASFLTTWNAALSIGPVTLQQLSSDATISGLRTSQLITTGALLVDLLATGDLRPYLAIGAGYIASQGESPSATLVGNYRFQFTPPISSAPLFVIDQTDTVGIRSSASNTVTWVLGGGVKYHLSQHWGVRADVRDHINHDVIRTTISATPASASSGSGALTLGFFGGQTLVFSSNTPGFPSTLSAPVSDFRTFSGTGLINQVNASAGIFWRF
jgi:hypothetical protein